MSAESEEIAIHILYIHCEVRSTLGTIHHHRHTVLVSNFDHLLHWIHCTQHVAYLGNAHNFGALSE